jgi:hypothetical protein
MTGISGSQSLGSFVAHGRNSETVTGGTTDVAEDVESLNVGVTVGPVEPDVVADGGVQANKKRAASTTRPEILTQSTYRGIVIDLTDRRDRSARLQWSRIRANPIGAVHTLSIVMRDNAQPWPPSRTAPIARAG